MESWQQGEHVAIFGPTGVGKTHFLTTIIEERIATRGSYGLIFGNKPKDPTLSALLREGWRRVYEWPPSYEDRVGQRVVFWPRYPGPSRAKSVVPIFEKAIDGIMSEGGWLVGIDEVRWWIEQMGLRANLDELWNAGRSSRVTLVAGAQGPSWVNTTMKEQLSWGVFFRPQHRERSKDIADITGDRDLWPVLASLKPHEFLLARLRTDEVYISRLPKP